MRVCSADGARSSFSIGETGSEPRTPPPHSIAASFSSCARASSSSHAASLASHAASTSRQ
eukprot:5884337-Prymnesium_polylepis.1